MKQQNYGRIVFTTSDRAIFGEYALPGLAHYGIGKMAQIGLMNVLNCEGADFDIKVNAIAPVAKTRMWKVENPNDLKPEQVACGALALVAKEFSGSGYIVRASNGQFSAIKLSEREKVDYPYDLNAAHCATPEEFLGHWEAMKKTIYA